jgi:hypothetical protein
MRGRLAPAGTKVPIRRTDGHQSGAFLSGPAPVAVFTPPSLATADDKRQFAATRRARWFGLPD